MTELFTLSGYIFAFIIAILYEYQRISQLIRKPKNNVHFYVARDKDGDLWFYMGKPFRSDTEFYADSKKRVFCLTYNIDRFGLKYEDFNSLKWEDEPVEVFINLED